MNTYDEFRKGHTFRPFRHEIQPRTIRWWHFFPEDNKMMDSDINKPQPSPKGTGREVTPLVIKDLELRSKMGAEKYGEALRAFNGRDPLVDAYQEALDLVQYLRQAIEEKQAKLLDEMDIIDAEITPHMAAVPAPGLNVKELWARPGRIIPVAGPESIAQEAHRLVLGDRGEAYGHPIFDMTRSADMLTALLRDKLRPGVRLEAEDIGQAMVCVKQSRQRNKAKRDNLTDTAGYALTLQMIAEWRLANPGKDPRDVFPAA